MSDSLHKIQVAGLCKYFGEGAREVQALADINLEVHANEFVTLVGASGCGKSTLLRILGGLETDAARAAHGPA